MPGDMPTATNGRKVSRPAQGKNSLPVPTAKAQYAPAYPPTARVSTGSVSRPKSTGKWKPKAYPAPRRARD